MDYAISALRKTPMLFWILMLRVVAALKCLLFSKLPSAIKGNAIAARGQWGY
jgi:hypothetical protein